MKKNKNNFNGRGYIYRTKHANKVNENGETESKEFLVVSSGAYMKTNSNFKF